MTAETKINLAMWTSILDEQIKPKAFSRIRNSSMISNWEDNAMQLHPCSCCCRQPCRRRACWRWRSSRLKKESSDVVLQHMRESSPKIHDFPSTIQFYERRDSRNPSVPSFGVCRKIGCEIHGQQWKLVEWGSLGCWGSLRCCAHV
jgi:hypothetical protein